MIPKEILSKVQHIRVKAKRTVTSSFSGEYESAFKGRGMEFSEVREYQPGDEVRSIDWNVTARTGLPFVKRYVEERELTLYFLVDISASGSFGRINEKKKDIAAEIASLIAFSAMKNNDKVGLILFSDIIELFVPPGKGLNHVLRIIRELLYFKPANKGTSIENALKYLGNIAKRNSVVFLLSDFFDRNYERALKTASRRYDFTSIIITSNIENNLPDAGLVPVKDMETGLTSVIDTSSGKTRKYYINQFNKQLDNIKSGFISSGIDFIDIVAGKDDYIDKITKFFLRREALK